MDSCTDIRGSSEVIFLQFALFGEKYEAFQDNRIARAVDFQAVRPYFEYAEISNSGSSIQEKPAETAKAIVDFLVID